MKKLFLFALAALCSTMMFAQKVTVTGTVTSKDDGQPIPGTNVQVKGTKAGVETGAADASSFLNAVRERADATATDVVATKALVDQENQKEFIGEGHRFFDIMRRGGSLSRSMVDDPDDFAGATPYTISWDDYRVALPISSTERVTYKELQQNPGYKD